MPYVSWLFLSTHFPFFLLLVITPLKAIQHTNIPFDLFTFF